MIFCTLIGFIRLSPWESWREAPERARTLTVTQPRRDTIPLTKSLPIAVSVAYPHGLALSVTCGDTSPKGRGFVLRPDSFPPPVLLP